MIGLANHALRRSIVLLIVGLTVVGCGGVPQRRAPRPDLS
jgi:hypothetical protein